jgi:F-type H+-transporting ATPase subunit delta
MASVTNVYARAFADAVLDQRLDAAKILQEGQALAQLVAGNDTLRAVWEAPSIPAEQKRNLLDAIIQREGFSQTVRNFMAVLIDHRRTAFLSAIVRQFEQELNQRLGFVEADITSARDLNPAERSGIETQVEKLTGKKVRARYSRDAAILGGAIIRVGSTIYDGSVSGQLERIREQLTST